jgi:hypothetical protein
MSTEFLEQDQKDIYTIIQKNTGISYDDLYTKCSLDKKDLSLTIHKLTQLMLVYKSDNLFFIVGISDEDIAKYDEKKKKAAELKVVNSKPVVEKVKKEEKFGTHPWREPDDAIKAKVAAKVKEVKPCPPVDGTVYLNLNRKTINGLVAYFFYKNRDSGFAYSTADVINKLSEYIDLGKNPSVCVYQLSSAGVIEKVNDDFKKFYKWNEKYDYPFSTKLPSDVFLIPTTPLGRRESVVPVVPVVPTNEVIMEAVIAPIELAPSVGITKKDEVLLGMLQARIDMIKSELLSLETMKLYIETN